MKNFFSRPIHQSFFLVAMSIGIIAGTILGLVFHIAYFASPIWLALVVLLFICTYFRPKYVFLVLALVAGFLLAFFRVASVLENQTQPAVSQQTKQTQPAKTAEETKTQLQPAGNQTTETRESWLLTSRDWFANRIRTELSSHEAEPSPHENETNLAPHETNPSPHATNSSSREAGLALSYLLGEKSDLDKSTAENLRAIGLVHIVVASGTHLSILVGAISKIFKKISRRVSLLFSVLFIIVFMALVGFTPSILRAGLMSILTLIAAYSGRKIAPWRLILLVAATTLVIDPTFITNLGWLLSFASYTGIMILGPALTYFFYEKERLPFLASLLLTSISATFLTLPITLYYFGQISLLSLLANLLILPTLPLAMALIFATGLLAGLPLISPLVAFVTAKLLSLHLVIVEFFAAQTNFLITTDRYQPQVFLLYIPILLPFIIGLIRHKVLKLNKVDYMGEKYVRTQ
ncbi:ComEC/Rec2 family competence protein [Candidatus Saccharibacteria bacterium]|nr:ComEC/Rec2 family competence protein [Candidatus Saccharibacteria bacterium]